MAQVGNNDFFFPLRFLIMNLEDQWCSLPSEELLFVAAGAGGNGQWPSELAPAVRSAGSAGAPAPAALSGSPRLPSRAPRAPLPPSRWRRRGPSDCSPARPPSGGLARAGEAARSSGARGGAGRPWGCSGFSRPRVWAALGCAARAALFDLTRDDGLTVYCDFARKDFFVTACFYYSALSPPPTPPLS